MAANDKETLDALFNGDNMEPEAGAEAPAVAPKKASKTSSVVDAEASKELAENPDIVNVLSTRSDDIEVTNIYYTYQIGNIKPDKSQPKNEKGRYPVVQCSHKAGYMVKNVSDQPIAYMKPNYVLNPETGRYEDQAFEATLAPGEEAVLDRLNMVKLMARPEFSFKTRNGKIVKSSKNNVDSQEEYIRSYHFKFSDDTGLSVNDDSIGVSIDAEGADGQLTVAEEFLPVFGYVLNVKEKKERAPRKAGKRKISAQEASAMYLMRVMQGKAKAEEAPSEK